MPNYYYQALDDNGKQVQGEIKADSVDTAKNIIASKGFIPVKVSLIKISRKDYLNNLAFSSATIKTRDLILFTKQFRTMIKAGIAIMEALNVLESQAESPVLRNTLSAISRDVGQGVSLFEAFSKHPRVFNNFYCNIIEVGEASGSLVAVLDRLAHMIEHEYQIKTNISTALQYPVIVIVFFFVAFFLLLTYVVPTFARIFVSAGLELPITTQICIQMYQVLIEYWPFLVIGLIGCVFTGGVCLRTRQGRYYFDVFLLNIPLIGTLFEKAAMSRFASLFSILQTSGVSILTSLDILARVIGNTAISREFEQISIMVETGHGLSGPLKSAAYFPPMVVHMVRIGEESGQLEEMLSEITIHYDFELDYTVKRLSDAIGPLLTIGLAVVVGFFALAILVPMWDMAKIAR